MKKSIKFFALSMFFIPFMSFAQEVGAGPATFANSPTLWMAIVLGLIASFIGLKYAFQMKSSTVGGILQLLGWGMSLVVLGFISVAIAWAQEGTQKIVHDLLFIVGYILMLSGLVKVRKLSM